jgi:alkylated DNA repair protein (DNA oxidative demethylase)
MEDLLERAAPAKIQSLAPGLTLYRHYLGETAQQLLTAEIAQVLLHAPWHLPTMPRSGRPFSVRMTNCGSLGWVSSRDGYRYQPMHPVTGGAWPPIPSTVLDIWRALASYPHLPEACLINFYDCRARMGLHQDRDEADLAAPVISISLGDTCSFRYGGLRRSDPAEKIELCSGDVIVMGGPSRLVFHGVDKIYSGTSSLLLDGGRINLTLRRVTLP